MLEGGTSTVLRCHRDGYHLRPVGLNSGSAQRPEAAWGLLVTAHLWAQVEVRELEHGK